MSVSSERKFVTPARELVAQQRGPVRLRFIESEQGTFIELGVEYDRAEVPDRRYFADYCKVVEARAGISFIFGRLAVPGNGALRTKVEISYPEPLFIQNVWNSSRTFQESIEKDF
ncbi:MAG TPA: hypothetical protein VME43_32485, partial [Bryobacteraceae bacterium]|nr:hypothetical protein [Bryobacteraceae bacterium]